ncbi:mitochondrial assembly of ribosomal large subunit protein 1 [Aulostomus maculatus]
MNTVIINRFNALVRSSKRLLEQTGSCRRFCSVPKSRRLCPVWPRYFTANTASCQYWHHKTFSTRLFDSKRYFSEMSSESSHSNKTAGVTPQDSDGMESDLSQRSSLTFSLDVLVSLLRHENAVDICVIKVPEHITYTQYLIVVSGISQRHLSAMALYAIKVYKFLKKDHDLNVKIEGKNSEDWMCIDFGAMVVHFMLPETREVYELEKLWTLRSYDEQLKSFPTEMLPKDFILDPEDTK